MDEIELQIKQDQNTMENIAEKKELASTPNNVKRGIITEIKW